MNNKIKILLAIVITAAISIITVLFVENKTIQSKNNNPSTIENAFKEINGTGINEIYNKGGVKVSVLDYVYYQINSVLTSEETKIKETTGVSPIDNFIYLLIQDGDKKPTRIISPQPDSIPVVQFVSNDCIVIVMEAHGGFSDLYVINRSTGAVSHYPHNNLAYLSTTSDGQKIVFFQNNSLVVYDAKMQKLQTSPTFVSAGIFSLGYISPDGKMMAFHERTVGDSGDRVKVFVYDLGKNTVKQLGKVDVAGDLVWKDNDSFVNKAMNVVDGKEQWQEKEIFTIKQ